MGRSRGIGRRHRWEVGTEETNEVDALREPAAGRGQESEDALPSLPGGMNLNKRRTPGDCDFCVSRI